MPYRKVVFATEEIYHVFNRSIAKASIFSKQRDCKQILDLINYYRFAPKMSFSHYKRLEKSLKEKYLQNLIKNNHQIVEILCFCIMPNHFHLLLKQKKEQGIKIFISNIQNSYAKYFNLRSERSGSLFQAMFKAIRIEDDEQLIHVSRYIHLNPSTAFIEEPENLLSYQWSSLPEYLGITPGIFTRNELIIDLIGGKEKYKEFVFDQVDYQRELDKIKHLYLE